MQPLKISIEGKYWDSFIYAGRLYLFCIDGSLLTINWEELVKSLLVPAKARLAQICAFLRSDYLYGSDLQLLFNDEDVRDLISKKFSKLNRYKMFISEKELHQFAISMQDNPVDFPHADIEIYKSKLYVGNRNGLFTAGCGKTNKYGVSTKPVKEWDGPITGLSANYGSLAMAAGSEGLFEIEISRSWSGYGDDTSPTRISTKKCHDCGWAFYSIFGTTADSGYLAEFSNETTKTDFGPGARRREFEGIKNAKDIFGTDGYSWGVRDKLCQASQSQIKVVRYKPWADEPISALIGSVQFDEWKGNIISASTATFGVVVELDNALVIFPSVGETITIPGEPTNWRVFTRAKYYENQLHVVWDNQIDIFSFNHDYLVDQEKKILGTEIKISRPLNHSKNSLFDLLEL